MNQRSIRLGIQIAGQMHYYLSDSGFSISATGAKFAAARKNECDVEIRGLSRQTINYLLGNIEPFKRGGIPHLMTLDAGRQKTGMQRLFIGDIVGVSPSQPPDNTISIKGLTGSTVSHDIVTVGGTDTIRLSEIAAKVAASVGAVLRFEVEDKAVKSYTYTGSAWGQIQRLADIGQCRAFLDDGILSVIPMDSPLKNSARRLSKNTGMVDVPQITEYGIDVTFLIDGYPCQVGAGLIVESEINPAASGNYIIAQLGFDVASHDDAFFYAAKCKRW